MVNALKYMLALVALAPLGILAVFGVGRIDVDTPRLVQLSAATLLYAGVVTLITGVLGALFGWLFARSKQPTLEALLMFPVALPAVVLCMGAYDIAGQHAANMAGVIAVTTVAYLPWVIGPTKIAFMRVDAALEEAARLMGATPLQVMREIAWPLVKGEWRASVLLVFSLTAATFGVPYFLQVKTLTTDMVERLQVGGSQAFAQSLLSGAILVVLSLGAQLFINQQPRADIARPSVHVPMKAPALSALAWVFALGGIVAPLTALLVRARGYGDIPWQPIARSAYLATACATTVVAIGVLWAITKPAPLATKAIRLVYALPGTLVALAWALTAALHLRLIVLDRVTFILALQGSLWLLGLAYVSKYLAVGVDTTDAAFLRVSSVLTDAARMSGATRTRALLDVTLPMSKASLVAAFALLWMTFFAELTLSVMLFGQTLGTTLFELATYTDPQRASALAVIVAALCILVRRLLRAH